MRSYLAALEPSGRNVLKEHAGKEAGDIRRAICELPIDEFFADVVFALGQSTLEPIDWMNTREPNQAHQLIARLVESLDISTVLTANFDRLLEKKLPGFESVLLMKRRSRTGEYEVIGSPNMPVVPYTPTYMDPSLKRVFHLHGTSLRTRLEITPGTTSLPFDHFDQANLAERLGGTTLLVVGSSGGWDYDILAVLKLCDIAQVLWICHDDCRTITEGEVPRPWLEFFDRRAEAIKGDTTRILAELARVEHEEVVAGGVSEFEEYVVGHFKDCETKRKLYTWAVLVNKVLRGDVANSILYELEKEPTERIEQDEEEIEKERKYLAAVKDADSLTMHDGRRITPEQFMSEYENKKRVYARMREGFWQVMIARTRTVAMSRDPRYENNKREAVEFLRDQVLKELEKILPYESIGPQEMVEFKWITREWMLAHESAGILYYEDGNANSAIVHLNLALRICRNEEDRYRIQKTMIIVNCILKFRDLLNVGEAEEVKALLENRAAEIDDHKADKLMMTADQVFFAGGRIQALEVYEGITQRWPDNVLACLNYSNMLRTMLDFRGALSELDRCLKERPYDYRLHCNKGYALNELGRQREAIPVLEKALELCGRDKHAWVNLGNSYYETNRLREALDKYQQALTCDPDFEIAHTNKENTLRRLAKRIW
jgi:Tfp pilus assembly protein PilF